MRHIRVVSRYSLLSDSSASGRCVLVVLRVTDRPRRCVGSGGTGGRALTSRAGRTGGPSWLRLARELLQAAVIDRRRAAFGAAVDVGHASTMVLLALVDRRRRRLAAVSALLATAFGLTGRYLADDQRVGGVLDRAEGKWW